MKTTNKHVFFWGGIYSQWFLADMTIDGIEYNCAEQYMMHQKAIVFEDTEIAAQILKETNPRNHKALGRKIQNFDSAKWSSVCEDIVLRGNTEKFLQNPRLQEELFQTGDRLLVEASPLDTVWGIGMHENDEGVDNPENWKGTNLLGIAITKARNILRDLE